MVNKNNDIKGSIKVGSDSISLILAVLNCLLVALIQAWKSLAIYAFHWLYKLGGTFLNCNYQKVKHLFDLSEIIS